MGETVVCFCKRLVFRVRAVPSFALQGFSVGRYVCVFSVCLSVCVEEREREREKGRELI